MEHEARRRSAFGSLCQHVTNRCLDTLHETQAGLDLFFDYSGSKGEGDSLGPRKHDLSRDNRRMAALFSKLHAFGLGRFDIMDLGLGRMDPSVGRALRKTLHPGMCGIHLWPVDATALESAGIAHRRGELTLSAVGGTRSNLPCVFTAKTTALVAPSSGTNILLALALALNAIVVVHRHEQLQGLLQEHGHTSESDAMRRAAVATAYDDYMVRTLLAP